MQIAQENNKSLKEIDDHLMDKLIITIEHSVGLHARPAAQFVQTANEFDADITVKNLTSDTDPVNAKSILSVLSLGVHQGYQIEIIAEGEDEKEALTALKKLIEDNFGEE
jgi:phosphotransferase system HPr (HPr) family protein